MKKEKKYSKNGKRQIVDTGWKEFDKQTNWITTGNAVCATQYSSYIRPWSETECNDISFKPGELLEHDLRPFLKHGLPADISENLRFKERSEKRILYMFWTSPRGSLKLEPFLWVVTTAEPHPRLVMKRVMHYPGQSWKKRYMAADEILKYITEDWDEKG